MESPIFEAVLSVVIFDARSEGPRGTSRDLLAAVGFFVGGQHGESMGKATLNQGTLQPISWRAGFFGEKNEHIHGIYLVHTA